MRLSKESTKKLGDGVAGRGLEMRNSALYLSVHDEVRVVAVGYKVHQSDQP